MLAKDDPIFSELKETFKYHYHPDISHYKDGPQPAPQSPPFSFYDRHIGSNLILKNIVYLPSITHSLSKVCDKAIHGFLQNGHKFYDPSFMTSLETDTEDFLDAYSVSDCHSYFVGDICHRYASKFALHPDHQEWDSVFCLVSVPRRHGLGFVAQSWLMVNHIESDGSLLLVEKLADGLTEATKDKLEDLLQKYPRLATWDIFAMTDTALAMFQTATENASFNWEVCRTLGSRTISYAPPPPDVKNSVVSLDFPKKFKPHQRGTQSRSTKTAKVVTTTTFRRTPRRYRPDFRHYLQCAWAKAATYDSTFIILHCGRYERIGFRHRGSQTLYLSGVIDTINIQNPHYMKLQIGLHVAIVQDAFERQKLVNLVGEKTGEKRSAEHHNGKEMPNAKRRKNTPIEPARLSQITSEIANRRLALVNLDYGAFCSPAPSSFIRVGTSCAPGHMQAAVNKETEKARMMKSRYHVHEYFSLTLKEPLGKGAVGVVHPAILELTLESGEILKHNLTIKLAFLKTQQKKLLDEYRIYAHIWRKKGVKGIVTVHGLFKDPESGTLAMLMSDGGQTLRQREKERSGNYVQVSATHREKNDFINALKSIHTAGVRHHDIRADNLLINSENEVFIIDFDRADCKVQPAKVEHELACLNDLLEGRYQSGNYYT